MSIYMYNVHVHTFCTFIHVCCLGNSLRDSSDFIFSTNARKNVHILLRTKKMYVDQEMMPFKFGALSVWWLNIYSPDLTSFYCAYFHIDAGEILSVITHLVANSLFVLILAPCAHTNKRTDRTKITITITTVAIAESCTIEFKQNKSTMRAK